MAAVTRCVWRSHLETLFVHAWLERHLDRSCYPLDSVRSVREYRIKAAKVLTSMVFAPTSDILADNSALVARLVLKAVGEAEVEGEELSVEQV